MYMYSRFPPSSMVVPTSYRMCVLFLLRNIAKCCNFFLFLLPPVPSSAYLQKAKKEHKLHVLEHVTVVLLLYLCLPWCVDFPNFPPMLITAVHSHYMFSCTYMHLCLFCECSNTFISPWEFSWHRCSLWSG